MHRENYQTYKKGIINDSDPINNLIRFAKLQDLLLQSYRRHHLLSQFFLLLIGVFLTLINTIEFEKMVVRWFVIILTFSVGFLAIILNHVFKNITRSREDDVYFWHNEIIKCEEDMPIENKFFTSFKIYQKEKRGEKGVRESLRPIIFTAFPIIWGIMLLFSLFFFAIYE